MTSPTLTLTQNKPLRPSQRGICRKLVAFGVGSLDQPTDGLEVRVRGVPQEVEQQAFGRGQDGAGLLQAVQGHGAVVRPLAADGIAHHENVPVIGFCT